MSAEPSLFDEIEAEQCAQLETAKANQLATWEARFKIPPRPLPWTTSDLREKGIVVDDWYACPLCERVHLGAYSLLINCGWRLGSSPVWAFCCGIGRGSRFREVCGNLSETQTDAAGWPHVCAVEPRFHDGPCRMVPLAEWKQRPSYVEWLAERESMFGNATPVGFSLKETTK